MYNTIKKTILHLFWISCIGVALYFYQIEETLLSIIFLIIGIGYLLSILTKKSENKIIHFFTDLLIITGFTALITLIIIETFIK